MLLSSQSSPCGEIKHAVGQYPSRLSVSVWPEMSFGVTCPGPDRSLATVALLDRSCPCSVSNKLCPVSAAVGMELSEGTEQCR